MDRDPRDLLASGPMATQSLGRLYTPNGASSAAVTYNISARRERKCLASSGYERRVWYDVADGPP